jgi:hypothetical protein
MHTLAERVGYMSEKTTPLLRRYIRSRGKTKTGPLFVSREGRLSYAMFRVMFNRCVDGITNVVGSGLRRGQARGHHARSVSRKVAIDVFDRGNGIFGTISEVFEDRDGHIWVATNPGVQRFDGYRLYIILRPRMAPCWS